MLVISCSLLCVFVFPVYFYPWMAFFWFSLESWLSFITLNRKNAFIIRTIFRHNSELSRKRFIRLQVFFVVSLIKFYFESLTRIGMVYMSKRQQTHRTISAQGHPLSSMTRRVKPHTTGQAAAGSKTSLYTGTARVLPLYTQVT